MIYICNYYFNLNNKSNCFSTLLSVVINFKYKDFIVFRKVNKYINVQKQYRVLFSFQKAMLIILKETIFAVLLTLKNSIIYIVKN